MQDRWSYVKDSNDFIKQIKHLKNIPDNTLLVAADVAGQDTSQGRINDT